MRAPRICRVTARGDRWGALRRLGDRYQATDAAADLLSTFPQVTAWDFMQHADVSSV